jgi:hypothetical protein
MMRTTRMRRKARKTVRVCKNELPWKNAKGMYGKTH